MQSVDLRGDYAEYLLDTRRKIPEAHLKEVCLFKQSQRTCRYICLSVKGYICVKKTPLKHMIDNQVKKDNIKAIGDNCEGLGG